MARVCEITGKGTTSGQNRSHSMRATKRTFKANIQKKRMIDPTTGRVRLMKLAASTIRTLAKQSRSAAKLIAKESI